MRLLSDQELDDVLGGQDQISAIKLSAVTVNATVVANPDIVFSVGAPDVGPVPGGENGSNAPCYASFYYALSQLPSFNHLRCVASHTVKPGYDLVSGVDMILLNGYASGPAGGPAQPGGIDLTRLTLGDTTNYPAGNTQTLSGLYQSTSVYHKVTLTANAFMALTVPVPYVDVNTGASMTWNSGMNAAEHIAFVLGHEASHMHGITDENTANGYGIYAMQQWDKLPAGTCP